MPKLFIFLLACIACFNVTAFDQLIDDQFAAEQNAAEKPRIDKLVLVTGCPRSGTRYIAQLLCACGLDVHHEGMGRDGCSSWCMAVDTDVRCWGPSANGYRFQHVFHQVRDPLPVMSSIYTHEALSWNYNFHCIPELSRDDSLFVRTAKYWYYWNLAAEKKAELTYRVEDIDFVFEEICTRLNIPVNMEALKKVPREVGKHKRDYARTFTWADMKNELPEDLFHNIQEMALRYGYPIED